MKRGEVQKYQTGSYYVWMKNESVKNTWWKNGASKVHPGYEIPGPRNTM